jgi:hypothetical protein
MREPIYDAAKARKIIDRANAIRDGLIRPPWMDKPKTPPKRKRLRQALREAYLRKGFSKFEPDPLGALKRTPRKARP